MITCHNCGSVNSIAPIKTPDGDEFILVSKPSNGNFTIPPNGLVVKAVGCTNCGITSLYCPELIGKAFTK